MRGELSSPIIAILLTVVVVAAGLVAAMWFLRAGNAASKDSMILVLGQPALIQTRYYTSAVVTIKNVGSEPVTVEKIVIRQTNSLGFGPVILTPNGAIVVNPGETTTVTFYGLPPQGSINATVIQAALVTDKGTIPILLYVVPNVSNSNTNTNNGGLIIG